MTLHASLEFGCVSDVVVAGERIIKTTREPYNTLQAAEATAAGLATYAHDLSLQPLRTAALLDVAVVSDGQSHYLQHAYERIEGPSMARLPVGGKRQAVASVVAQIASMDTIGGNDTLFTPIDAKPQNFHVDSDGPALIDVFPILTRLPDGSFPLDQLLPVSSRGRGGFFPWAFGTKTGAITCMLSGVVDRGGSVPTKLTHIVTKTDSWCYDVLPSNMDSRVKDGVRRQIRWHFAPYMARLAYDRAATVAGKYF